jgi:tetratricopeptide (TPR) repeat protein
MTRVRKQFEIVVLAGTFGALALLLRLQLAASREYALAERSQRNLSGARAIPMEAAANNRGVDYASKRQYDQAIGYFRCALYFNESYLPAYKNLLAAYVETKRWPEALKAGEKAQELYPLSVELQKDPVPDDPKKVKQLYEDRGFIADLGRA